MQYHKLGNTGIEVSVMALGCWPFAGGKVWGEQSDDDSILAEVRRIAESLGHPMAAVALAWVRQQPGVTSFLVGARKPEELAWNLPSLELALAADVVAELNRVTEPVKRALNGNPDMWLSPSRMR